MATTTVPSVLAPGFSGRNLLINPGFNVNQRVYVSGTATVGANQYTLDRWRVVTSGQSLTFASGVATAPAGGVEQVIEGLNIVVTGTYVLSWTGTATATVAGNAVTNGGTVALTAGTNATVRFTGGTVSLPQLEFGSTPSTFEQRTFALELDLCQRYYEKSYDYATAPGAVTTASSVVIYAPVTGSWAVQGRYLARKRTAVNPVVYSTNGASGNVRNATAGSDVAATIGWTGELAFRADTTGTSGNAFNFHWVCDAEL